MIQYFRVTDETIKKLKKEWKKFANNCFAEIERQVREESTKYYNEAANDKFLEEYTEESIDEWYYDSIKELENWASNLSDKIESTYNKGIKLIEEIENMKIYEDDIGVDYTLYFYEGKIEKEKNYQKTYSVTFNGMYWDIDGVEIEFDPPTAEYTEWFTERKR